MCNLESDKPKDKSVLNLIKGNALKYMRFKDQLDQIPERELLQFRIDVASAFERIPRNNDSLFIQFVDRDPYRDLAEMSEDIMYNKQMLISSLNNDSKLMPGVINLKFRAVHDYLHYLLQQPFNFQGEYKVYQAQKFMHTTKMGRQILYSEIVLQAAYCEYYGAFADKQKVVL